MGLDSWRYKRLHETYIYKSAYCSVLFKAKDDRVRSEELT